MDYVYSPGCIQFVGFGVERVKKDEYFVKQVDLAQLHTIRVWPRKKDGVISYKIVEFLDNQANTLLFRGNPAEKVQGLPSKDFTLKQGYKWVGHATQKDEKGAVSFAPIFRKI